MIAIWQILLAWLVIAALVTFAVGYFGKDDIADNKYFNWFVQGPALIWLFVITFVGNMGERLHDWRHKE